MSADVKQYLFEQGIQFQVFQHAPVFTCEEAKEHSIYQNIRGVHSKNLFLKDKKSKRFFLLIVPEHIKVNMDEVGLLVSERIKFANVMDLQEILHLTPGSVSPFGLLNDKEHKVEVLINTEVWESEYVSFHPNINTETLELAKDDFHKYIKIIGNEYRVL